MVSIEGRFEVCYVLCAKINSLVLEVDVSNEAEVAQHKQGHNTADECKELAFAYFVECHDIGKYKD